MAALALTPTVLFPKFNIVLLLRISLEPFSAITSLLPPPNEVCEGYVFTGVCLSTGSVADTPWADTPRQTPLQADTPPPGRHPLGRSTPPPLGQTPHHRADHPPLGRHPPCRRLKPDHLRSACWDTVNKRVVRIPLECILVNTMLNFDISRNAKRYM